MLGFNSKYPMGIDIGNRNIYAAQVKRNRKSFEIVRLAQARLNDDESPGSSDGLVPALSRVSKKSPFLRNRAVVLFRSENIVNFPIRFRVEDGETIEGAIIREAEQHLPFSIDEAVIDYLSIDSTSPRHTKEYGATIVAARRDYIIEQLSAFKRSGLVVEAADFSLAPLFRLHRYLFGSVQGTVILAYLAHTQTLLSVVSKNSVLAQRSIPWGTELLSGKLKSKLEYFGDENRSKVLLNRYGLLYENRDNNEHEMKSSEDQETENIMGVVFQIIRPMIEELIYEFHKMIGYVRSEIKEAVFEATYLYGEGASVRHLDRYLERRLNIPTKAINPVGEMTSSEKNILPNTEDGSRYALALGLAMRKVKWL